MTLTLKILRPRPKDGRPETRTYHFYTVNAQIMSDGAVLCADCQRVLPAYYLLIERARTSAR